MKIGIKSKKYMLDENCYSAIGEIRQPNFFNVTDVMRLEGIQKEKKSFHDSVILDVAIKHNYIIITKDKGLAMLSILKGRDVVFSNFEGLHFLCGDTKKVKHLEDLK
jgi:predicted nuclease of predicted toxin-antitoxin system